MNLSQQYLNESGILKDTMETVDLKAVIQKEMRQQKFKTEIKSFDLGKEKPETFVNSSSAGFNIQHTFKQVKLTLVDDSTVMVKFQMFLTFKGESCVISYNVLPVK